MTEDTSSIFSVVCTGEGALFLSQIKFSTSYKINFHLSDFLKGERMESHHSTVPCSTLSNSHMVPS